MELEKRGIPTVTVVGDRFLVLGNYEREALGLPDLPLAVVPYPIGGVPAAEARRRVVAAFDQIIDGLATAPAPSRVAKAGHMGGNEGGHGSGQGS